MAHLEHQFGIASFNWSLKICPLILIVAGGRSSTIMSSVASWSSLPSSSLPSSLNSSSHILARFPQQEGTDLLLVDHYHQGEGILAGVSNEHHLPLLVLQVTAVLVLNRFECFNFPSIDQPISRQSSPSCKPSACPPSSPSSCLSSCTPWLWTWLCTFYSGLVVLTISTDSRPWALGMLMSEKNLLFITWK